MNTFKNKWYKLDNAAKIFPAVITKETPAVFRIQAVLKEPIKIKSLQDCLDSVINRFPYFKVYLRKGFFWYYLDPNPLPFTITPESDRPNKPFNLNKKYEYPLRVIVYKNHVSVEFAHILTDGTGGLEFLKTLLAAYFKKTGIIEVDWENILNPDTKPDVEEFEDGYNRYFNRNVPKPDKISKAFHLSDTKLKHHEFSSLLAQVDETKLHSLAISFNVSITGLLAAVYLYCLQEIYLELPPKERKKNNPIIRVQIPINLRNIFPSKTMRNFALFIMPEIDMRLGTYSFEEILKTVHHNMKLLSDKKQILKIIYRNVRSEKNIFVRLFPLFFKNIVLSILFKSLGTKLYSGVITNLGKVNLPEEFSSHIDSFRFIAPPAPKLVKKNMAVISYNNKTIISFGDNSGSKQFEQKYIRFLIGKGLNIKVLTFKQ
jgi:NRPS condensation-like uncharacterized protein